MMKTTNTTQTEGSQVKVVIGDKQFTPTEMMDKLAQGLKIDSDVLKVILLLAVYIVALMMISSHAFGGNVLYVLLVNFFSRDTALLFFTLLSLPMLYLLAKWSRIIYFLRKPLNIAVSALMTLVFVLGVVLFWVCVQLAFWGEFHLILITIAAFALFAVAYLNSFLSSLFAVYEQKYEEANQDKIRAERFKSELITNVSHDIQTPLTSIINYTDLLRNLERSDEGFDEKFEDYTEVLTRKSARLKVLTGDLIEASKAATGNVSVDMQPMNLVEIIWQIAGEFDDQFSKRNLEFVFDPPKEPFIVTADSRHLWRVLENLFGNMAKYSLEGTRTFAQLKYVQNLSQADMVRLVLKNTSTEPLDQLAGELTEQFIRGDKSRHTEGSGLGLYIAKSLTELMGGDLVVQVSGDQFGVALLLKTDSLRMTMVV